MLELVWYSSASGNTDRFVEKLQTVLDPLTFPIVYVKINRNINIQHESQFPCILICPTYADGKGKHSIPKQVIKFLNHSEKTRKNLLGVIGTGNKNFGSTYCLSANLISKKCSIPVLYKLELSGTTSDVQEVSNILKERVK